MAALQKYGHAYDAFKIALTDSASIFADAYPVLPVLDAAVKKELLFQIRKR
jgi:hypothetical protein